MIRKRLAALVLTAGLGFFGGCMGFAPAGPSNGGMFGHLHHNRNGSTAVAGVAPAPCCPTCSAACGPECCPSAGFEVGGVYVPEEGYAVAPSCPNCATPPTAIPGMPPGAIQGLPPAGAPTTQPPPFPMLTEPPLGSNTKFSAVPQAIPVPYFPYNH